MPGDYTKAVLDKVQQTTNTKKGMESIIDATSSAVFQIDHDVADILLQRERLVTIHQQYRSLYMTLTGEEPITERPPVLPMAAVRSDDMRQHVLDAALRLDNLGMDVSKETIISWLKKEKGITVTWKNPHAAVATVINRSGEWEKSIRTGNYVRRPQPESR